MRIAGLQKCTLLDYPGKVACTVFLPGCNFRCPFCHNYELIANPETLMEEAEFFSFLQKRKGLLQGVCVTGGEPTLQPELPAFMKKIRQSVLLLQESGVAYELRTTLCHPLHDEKTVENMAHWLQSFTKTKVKQLFLQPFVDRDTVPFSGFSAPNREELERYAAILSTAAEQVHIRGL